MREPNFEKDQKAVPQIYPANRPKSTGVIAYVRETIHSQSPTRVPKLSLLKKISPTKTKFAKVLLAYLYAAVRERACRQIA